MKLNEENGVKLEIKRSEINALNASYPDLMQSDDENLATKAVEKIVNILPSDSSVGVVFNGDSQQEPHILNFVKLAPDPNNNIEIPEQNWIIEEDEP